MKSEEFNRFLMEGGKLKCKKHNFIKNLSPSTVFKQSSSYFLRLFFTKFYKKWMYVAEVPSVKNLGV